MVSSMFERPEQISSPLLLPMLGSILSTGIIASLLILPPPLPTLTFGGLLLQSALDLAIAACSHFLTVWSIWRLIRDYVEPSVGTLVLHVWAVTVWLPLVITLTAERSLWISCVVPWAVANAVTFLNLWSSLPQDNEPLSPTGRIPLQPYSTLPLWRVLLPHCIVAGAMQIGGVFLGTGHPWSGTALISAGVLLFFVRHPFFKGKVKSRRKFSAFSLLQTAMVFVLISTALTPYLQKAYGLRSLAAGLAIQARVSRPAIKSVFGSHYSGVILTLPPKPHPRIVPPAASENANFSSRLARPVILPFDGVYWYFKQPDTRPSPDAHIQRGDPIKANIRSTDYRKLSMEAHQALLTPISGDCCRAIRVDLVNGDDRPGLIRVALFLRDTSNKLSPSVLLGSIAIPSSQLAHIPPNRQPVSESLRFQMPAKAHGRRFDEITVAIQPSSDRALGGSKIAIQNFVLVP
jgi:hypothetical protein